MDTISLFKAALATDQPVQELRNAVQNLLHQGAARNDLLLHMEALRNQLQKDQREADEDAVLDVMDFLVGWCSPHMEL